MGINKLNIVNGIIQDKFIDGIPVKIQIVQPSGVKNVRTLMKMTEVIGITNHNTGNSAPTAGDELHAKWLQNVENADEQYVSVHLFVDQDSITQTVPLNEVCYHAGDGSGNGNRKTISIEICENANVLKAEDNAKKLNAALLLTYPNLKIYKHQDWSGKYCPHMILDRPNGWVNFVADIQSYVNSSEPAEVKTPIIGKSQCIASQLEKFLLSKNPNPKLNISVKEFCELWISEGEIEGIKGDIAFCQACHETGYFKYGGLVLPEQNNYGGIGAVNNSAVGKGAWFDTPQMGVRASIQHLKAYGSKEALKQECIDPRFKLVTRGAAPNFEDLGGKWAYPGYNTSKYSSLDAASNAKDTYGHFIVKIFDELKKVVVDVPKASVSDWAKEAHKFVTENNISDGTRPKDNVTREEMWTMLYNYHKMK